MSILFLSKQQVIWHVKHTPTTSSEANPPEHSTGTEPTLTQVREQVTPLSRCKRTGLNIKTGLLITKELIPMQT